MVGPLFLRFGTMVFEFFVPNLFLAPIFIIIRPFFRFEGVGRGRGRSLFFFRFGTMIFGFTVPNLVCVPNFRAIRSFFHFEGVGWGSSVLDPPHRFLLT